MRYNDSARTDLNRMWYESAVRFGTAQADSLIERLTHTLAQTIGTFPNVGRARAELGSEVRSYPVVPYVAFYRVVGKRLEVLRVIHAHRDIKEPLMSLLLTS
jgi:toxin ParE1/3/4